jgi:small subunit ribosomal protein S16
MVKIRLFRTGAKKRPCYRVVAIDSRSKRQGRTLDVLGTYDPRGSGGTRIDVARYDEWVGKGAQVSDTVRSLVRRQRAAAAGQPEGTAAE